MSQKTPKVLMTYLDGLDAAVDGRGWGPEHEKAKEYIFRVLEVHDKLVDIAEGYLDQIKIHGLENSRVEQVIAFAKGKPTATEIWDRLQEDRP